MARQARKMGRKKGSSHISVQIMTVKPYSPNMIISRCGACAYKRNKCRPECPYAPYFSHTTGLLDYEALHTFFGSSKFLPRLIQRLPLEQRHLAVSSLIFEVTCRNRNPVLGCTAYFLKFEQQIADLGRQVRELQAQSYRRNLDQGAYPSFQLKNEAPQATINLKGTTITSPTKSSDLPEISGFPEISSPIHIPPISTEDTHSSWSDLIQYFSLLESPPSLDLVDEAYSPSSPHTNQQPSPTTDHYSSFNSKYGKVDLAQFP